VLSRDAGIGISALQGLFRHPIRDDSYCALTLATGKWCVPSAYPWGGQQTTPERPVEHSRREGDFVDGKGCYGAELSAAEARELAADLLAAADELEGLSR